MTTLVIVTVLVLLVLLATIIGIPAIQQRRLLRTRAHFGQRLLKAQDEERAAIARDLHDDIVQKLVGQAMQLRSGDPLKVPLIVDSLDGVVTQLREIARGLHPTAVERAGLSSALQELGLAFQEREDLIVTWDSDLGTHELTSAEQLGLYRVAQEALANIGRHASAQNVAIHLNGRDGAMTLRITDNGKGFSLNAKGEATGLGLVSMQERMALLGGTLRVESEPGHGATITANLPAKKRRTP